MAGGDRFEAYIVVFIFTGERLAAALFLVRLTNPLVAAPELDIKIFIDCERPEGLPTPEEIVQKCQTFDVEQAEAPFTDFPKRGFVPESKDGTQVAFVKHGSDIAMSEAITQNFVWMKFKDDPTVDVPVVYLAFKEGTLGYIVMELI